jgi:hypothetical protein
MGERVLKVALEGSRKHALVRFFAVMDNEAHSLVINVVFFFSVVDL